MAGSGLKNLYGEQRKLSLSLPGRKRPVEISPRTARRAVTISFVLLLVGMAVMTIHAMLAGHQQQREHQKRELALLAQLAAAALAEHQNIDTPQPPDADALRAVLPATARGGGHVFLIVENSGHILARLGAAHVLPHLREGTEAPQALQAAMHLSHAGMVMSIRLADGARALAAAHGLSWWPGRVVVLRPAQASLLSWDGVGTPLLLAFLVLMASTIGLLALYNHQANRTEISEEKRACLTSRLDKALLLGRCGLWDWDVARGRIQLSGSMRKLLGMAADDGFMDMGTFLALQHPEETPLDKLLEKMLEEGRATFEHELRLRSDEGEWLWFKIRGALASRDEPESWHMVGIAVDITAQKRASKAMKEAERRLVDAIESISESFVLWDDQWRLVMCNSKFREFFGLPEEACAAGRPHEEVMRAARRRHQSHNVVSTDRNGREYAWELELDNGRWLQISERIIEGGGHVSVGTDITELKRKQKELESSRKRMQKTVEKLEQMRDELERRNERLNDMVRRYLAEKRRAQMMAQSKARFLAHMSHELRTPLGHVLAYSEGIATGSFGAFSEENYRNYAENIHSAAKLLSSHIEELLAYADVEAGEVKPEMKETPISRPVLQAMEQYREKARAKGVELRAEIARELEVRMDADLLAQALEKIIDNAVRFTTRGDIRVRAYLREGEEQGARPEIVIEVRDSGKGMPPEQVDKLMHPFERLGSAYQAHEGGIGLGLAIARALVELHEGRLEIDSREGEGTTVRFVLPGRLLATAQPAAAE